MSLPEESPPSIGQPAPRKRGFREERQRSRNDTARRAGGFPEDDVPAGFVETADPGGASPNRADELPDEAQVGRIVECRQEGAPRFPLLTLSFKGRG